MNWQIIFIACLVVATCCVWAWRSEREKNEPADTKPEKDDYERTKDAVLDGLIRSGIQSNHTPMEIDMMATYMYRFVIQEKAASYKEGFWNGQEAKIEPLEDIHLDGYQNPII